MDILEDRQTKKRCRHIFLLFACSTDKRFARKRRKSKKQKKGWHFPRGWLLVGWALFSRYHCRLPASGAAGSVVVEAAATDGKVVVATSRIQAHGVWLASPSLVCLVTGTRQVTKQYLAIAWRPPGICMTLYHRYLLSAPSSPRRLFVASCTDSGGWTALHCPRIPFGKPASTSGMHKSIRLQDSKQLTIGCL